MSKRIYCYFAEDYLHFMFGMLKAFKQKYGDVTIEGIAIRRSTVLEKLKNSPIPIQKYTWLNELEKTWVNKPCTDEQISEAEQKYGARNLRHLIICDRELGYGFMSGGVYAQSPLRKIFESNSRTRWQYIINMLEYFDQELERFKPDFIFVDEISFAFDLGLYLVAKQKEIPCYLPYYSRFGEIFTVVNNPYNQFTLSNQLFHKALSEPQLVAEKIDSARELIKRYRNRPQLPVHLQRLKALVHRAAQPINYLKTFIVDVARWAAILVGLKGTRGFLRQRSGLDILKTNFRIFSDSRRVLYSDLFEESKVHLTKNYIYMPLHVEPEAATLFLADKWTNQLTFIEQLAKSMPAGFKLLVKEHIPCIGKRPKGFYEKLKLIPDVHLITPFADSYELIQKSRLVAVISGTAAFEAVFLGKPALAIGRVQYSEFEQGFLATQNIGNMQDDILRAINIAPADEQRLEIFVASTLKKGVKMPFAKYAYLHYDENIEDFDFEPFCNEFMKLIEEFEAKRNNCTSSQCTNEENPRT